MATRLEKPLRREITVERNRYIVTISPEGLKLTAKGKRKGIELAWSDLVSGQGRSPRRSMPRSSACGKNCGDPRVGGRLRQ